jgi:hypothetical protein
MRKDLLAQLHQVRSGRLAPHVILQSGRTENGRKGLIMSIEGYLREIPGSVSDRLGDVFQIQLD